MMLHVPNVLTPDELAEVRGTIDPAVWQDGNATSGHQSALAKRNVQLPEGSAAAVQAGAIVRAALARNPLFMSAALPHTVYPPLFSRYRPGEVHPCPRTPDRSTSSSPT